VDSFVETEAASLPVVPEDEDDEESRVPMMRAAEVEQRTRPAPDAIGSGALLLALHHVARSQVHTTSR
jgi:hypothetical protein